MRNGPILPTNSTDRLREMDTRGRDGVLNLIRSSHQRTAGDTLWNNFELVECHLLTKLNGSYTLGVELSGHSTLGLDGI